MRRRMGACDASVVISVVRRGGGGERIGARRAGARVREGKIQLTGVPDRMSSPLSFPPRDAGATYSRLRVCPRARALVGDAAPGGNGFEICFMTTLLCSRRKIKSPDSGAPRCCARSQVAFSFARNPRPRSRGNVTSVALVK